MMSDKRSNMSDSQMRRVGLVSFMDERPTTHNNYILCDVTYNQKEIIQPRLGRAGSPTDI